MIRLGKSLMLLAAITVFPVLAHAQQIPEACRVRIEAPNSRWIIGGYDPFSADNPVAIFDVTFVNEGSAECRVRPTFDIQHETFGLQRSGSERLTYSLTDLTSGTDVTPRAGRSQHSPTQQSVVIEPNNQQVLRFELAVAPNGISSDGSFVQPVLISAETQEGDVAGSRQLTLGLDVRPAVMMGLSGAFQRMDGRAVVNLGALREGLVELPLNLYVQSTRGFEITVASQNSGRLRLAGTDWAIPYQMSLARQTLALSGDAVFRSSSGTGMTREQIPVNFVLGDVSAMRAGVYSDTITVTIAPS